MMQYMKDVIATRRMRKFKSHDPQNVSDQKLIMKRIKETGVRMDYVDAYIERNLNAHITFKTMLSFARRIAKELGLRVDRLAKRNRNALLCWFAENWEILEPRICEIKIDKDEDISSPSEDEKPVLPEIGELIKDIKIQNFVYPDPSDIFQLLNFH